MSAVLAAPGGDGGDSARPDARVTSRDAAFAVVLFAVALAPRLYVALAWAGEPVWDGHYYDFGARRIAAGLGYSDDITLAGQTVWHAWCHYPVGYSAFLGLVYRVFGASLGVAAAANAVVGALLAVVTWALARHALSERRARFAGAIVALHPGLVLYAALVMTEPLAALLTLTAFWIAVRDAKALRGFVLGALVLGVGALVRPQALLCAPFFGLLAGARGSWPLAAKWLEDPAPREGRVPLVARVLPRAAPFVLRAALACVLALVPVLPWTARNCRVMDGCALVSTNGGWNLAIGAFPRATGRFETLRSSDGCREVTGQVQQDRCWLAYGVAQIREHPGHWLALVPAKLGYTFDHESFAVEYLREARPGDWPEARRVAGRELLTFVHRLLTLAAVFGVVAFPRRGQGGRVQVGLAALVLLLAYFAFDTPLFWPLVLVASIAPWLPLPGAPPAPAALLLPVALLGTTVLTHAIFFGEDRYHVVVVPVLALLAAAALRAPRDPQKRTARAPSA